MIIVDLLDNITSLIALGVISQFIAQRARFGPLQRQLLVGALFAGVTFFAMSTPVDVAPGVILDGRSIILPLAGLVGGPISAIIAGTTALVFRWSLGGAGMVVGILVVIEATVLGVVWRGLQQRAPWARRWPGVWTLGCAVHVVMILLFFLLPDRLGYQLVPTLTAPVLGLYPIAIVLTATLMLDQEKLFTAEKAAKESAQRLQLALSTANLGAWDFNIPAGTAQVNAEYARMLGYDPATFTETQDAWIARMHPADRGPTTAALTDYLEGRAALYRPVFRLRTATGDWRWIESVGAVIERDTQGDPVRMTGIHADITEAKAAGRALADSERRHRELFEASPYPMWVFDVDTLAFLAVNDAAIGHYGYSREEFLSMTLADIRPASEIARLLEKTERDHHAFPESGLDEAGVWRHRKRDGTVISVEITTHRLEWMGHEAELVLAHDVTERLRAEADVRRVAESLEQLVEERTRALRDVAKTLEQRNRELQEANDAKTDFLKSMSHEPRTPLNSVIGFSGIMLQGMTGVINDEQRSQLEMINGSGKHLLALINDILDLSRIETGHADLHPRRIDVVALATETLEVVRPAADEKGLSLELRVTDEVARGVDLVSDPLKVRQILLNLLGNAVKFTETGGVVLRVESSAPLTIGFAIIDTGPGVPDSDKERIFGEFIQRPEHAGPEPEGTGLGLAISRGLAGLLGGTVTVSDQPGGGTCFTLLLPMNAFDPGGTSSAAPAARSSS